MTPYHVVVTFAAGANHGLATGNLFVHNDKLREMKLRGGTSTYVDFYATVGENIVKVWSEVQEGKFALDKGWTIVQLSVLGLHGTAGSIAVEVGGNGIIGALEVEMKSLEQVYHKDSDTIDKKKTMMVQISMLFLRLCLLGRTFP